MNGDPEKSEVAAAQAYFASMTRKAEIDSRDISTSSPLVLSLQAALEIARRQDATERELGTVKADHLQLAGEVQATRRELEAAKVELTHARAEAERHYEAWMVLDSSPSMRSSLAIYHLGMANKYHLAARYPWLPVEPDPPEPE